MRPIAAEKLRGAPDWRGVRAERPGIEVEYH